MKINREILHFTNPLYLESGRIIEPYDIIFDTYGEMNEDRSNVVLITHALSGSNHCCGVGEGDKKTGWWDNLIGDGKAIDTKKYFVICSNVIGGCYGSTGPMSEMSPGGSLYRLRFPVVTVNDMVKAQKILLSTLGIHKVRAIIGGSMGGMQVLSFGMLYPSFAELLVPIATTHATSPFVIGINKIMSSAIVSDSSFNDGVYDSDSIKDSGCSGLSTARMLGFMQYLSPATFIKKFNRDYVKTDGLYELFGRFEVERFLEYNGSNFPKIFDPLSYLYILKAISIFDISYNFENLESALKNIRDKMHLITFSGDNMFLPCEMREIKESMDSIGSSHLCEYLEIDSDYGHDSFLVEVDKYSNYIAEILKR